MLIQGARAIIMRNSKDNPPQDQIYNFARKLYEKKGFNITAVAIANKLARIAHACCRKKQAYQTV